MPGVYILTGSNTPEKEQRIKQLLNKELPDQGRDSSLQVYHAAEAPVSDILNDLSSGSLFGGRTVVLIRGAEEMLSDSLQQLAPYLRSPSPENTLIMEGGRIGARLSQSHPFTVALEKESESVKQENFPSPPPFKLAEWIIEQGRLRCKRKIVKESAEVLQGVVGDDLLSLVQELDKLDIVLPAGQEIRAEDIRKYTAPSRAHEPWDLPHPVARKEPAPAFRILKNLYDYNKHAVQIVPALGDHFLRLLGLKLYFSECPRDFEAARRLVTMGFKGKNELNPLLIKAADSSGFSNRPMTPGNVYPQMVIPRVLDQVNNYSVAQLQYIIRLLAAADADIKSGGLFEDSLGSMQTLLLYIMHSDKFRYKTRL